MKLLAIFLSAASANIIADTCQSLVATTTTIVSTVTITNLGDTAMYSCTLLPDNGDFSEEGTEEPWTEIPATFSDESGFQPPSSEEFGPPVFTTSTTGTTAPMEEPSFMPPDGDEFTPIFTTSSTSTTTPSVMASYSDVEFSFPPPSMSTETATPIHTTLSTTLVPESQPIYEDPMVTSVENTTAMIPPSFTDPLSANTTTLDDGMSTPPVVVGQAPHGHTPLLRPGLLLGVIAAAAAML